MSTQEDFDQEGPFDPLAIPALDLSPERKFPVVAIGASAGGLQAFSEMLKYLPSDTGMAFLYIQHSRIQGKGNLLPLLKRETSMTIQLVDSVVKFVPNVLYIVPPERRIIFRGGYLYVSPLTKADQMQMPIDNLFKLLAQTFTTRMIGILLSGTTNDGTGGLLSIRKHGGSTFVQDKTARFSGMAQSAIAAGAVQLMLSPFAISRELSLMGRITRDPALNISLRDPVEEESIEAISEFLSQFQERNGMNPARVPAQVLEQCLLRRMELTQITGVPGYLALLNQTPEEADVLFQNLMLKSEVVSNYTDSQQYLKNTVLPYVLSQKSANIPLRIWIPMFSSPMEAYSLAMLILELNDGEHPSRLVRIIASSDNVSQVERARTGFCSVTEVKKLPNSQRRRFFTEENDSSQVNKAVKDVCHFLVHDILEDPPFPKIDLVIAPAFDHSLADIRRERFIKVFYQALSVGGILLLTNQEDKAGISDLFNVDDAEHFRYSKKSPVFADTQIAIPPRPVITQADLKPVNPHLDPTTSVIKHAVDVLFGPSGVVVDRQWRITEFFGDTSLLLQYREGLAEHDLLKLARQELQVTLKKIIPAAFENKKHLKSEPLIINETDGMTLLEIEVAPINLDEVTSFVVVNFKFIRIFQRGKKGETWSGNQELDVEKLRNVQLSEQLTDLSADNMVFRNTQDDAAEKLKQATDELMATNEELRSVNDELAAAQSIMESNNDELAAGNEQLQIRNDQLSESYEYSEAILSTIQEGMVILDKSFNLKNGNDVFYSMFGLRREECEGRNFFEIGNKEWDIPGLRRLLARVIPNEDHFKEFEVSARFQHTGDKTLLLSARHLLQMAHHEELILLAVNDISETRKLGAVLMEKEKLLNMQLEEAVNTRTSEPVMANSLLAETNEELLKANEQLSSFSHISSHDLQEPLRKIQTFTARLLASESATLSDKAKKDFGKIRTAADRMQQLIQDLLAFSRLRVSDVQYVRAGLDGIVGDVVNELADITAAVGGTIICNALPAIHCIPFQISQVFHNLFSNALKFMRAGVPPVIEVSSKGIVSLPGAAAANKQFVQIAVSDNGIGFEEQYEEQIFGVFQRLHGQTIYPGTGIGLAIVKKVMENHKGLVTAKGRLSEGTTFNLYFPFDPAAGDDL